MTKIFVNNIEWATQTEFSKSITSNGSHQWFDSYGVIKSATTTTSSGTIATSTNAVSVGPVTVGSANTLTIHGEWRIV